MQQIAELDLPGYAIGGLAVRRDASGEYDTIEAVEAYMPEGSHATSWASAAGQTS
jgi:queuine tRNA-ribosyltransferase